MSLVALPPNIPKLIRLLASDCDGEVLATARAIDRTLKGSGLDFNDLATQLELGTREEARNVNRDRPWAPSGSHSGLTTWQDLSRMAQFAWLAAIRRQTWLSEWEEDFVAAMHATVSASYTPRLSPRQVDCLNRLLAKAHARGVKP
jgi:hypothetical protein